MLTKSFILLKINIQIDSITEGIIIGVIVTLLAAIITFIITRLIKWIGSRTKSVKIIRYMKKNESPIRSKYFDIDDVSSNLNLSPKKVEKLLTRSKKIKEIRGIQRS